MKYFTPDLYIRFNSRDDREADQAQEAWELAIEEYKRYVRQYRGKMSRNVRALAEKCCLHDAVLLGRQTHGLNGVKKAKADRVLTLGLHQGDETIVLSYFLWKSPKEFKGPRNWPYSSAHKHWLYDEIAVAENSKFMHRILWSDGGEVEVPFADVLVDRFPAQDTVAVLTGKPRVRIA